jgi:GT2 family glycosyltransferase
MKLKNEKQKPITIVYQGKKTIIYPGQIIDGPIQLSIYGLTPINIKVNNTVSTLVTHESSLSNYNDENKKEIEKSISFVQQYKKSGIPSVAICILSKDSYYLISECINSIIKNVKYKNTKIYIFDTGTSDKQTLQFYNSITNNPNTFPIQIINVGEYHFSKNYNYGLKLVDADFFLIQNNDTLAINDYVTPLIRIAITRKVGACGPRMLYKDGLIQHDGQIIYDHANKSFGGPTHVNLKRNVDHVPNGIHYTDGITCAGMLIKSSIFWEVGGLNEKYHDIFQDVELNIIIRMHDYAIICDRDALINHYDNTSRNSFWANNNEKLKLKHLDYNLLYGKFNNELKYVSRISKKFSIITVVNNMEQYINFLNDLGKQDCDFNFEIITLPNFNGEYNNCAEALNIGIGIAEGEYIMMCHQDLLVPNNWLSDIFIKIRELIINEKNFGVLGMAGSWSNKNDSDGVIYLTGSTRTELFTEVQCLDELCLIIKAGNHIRFDPKRFPNFHCYGTDLCLSYIEQGFKNFAINCPCTHLSDGFKNLLNEENLNIFIKNSIMLHKKWRNIIPDFRNTTCKFSKIENSIIFFIADELNKRGITMKKHVVLQD